MKKLWKCLYTLILSFFIFSCSWNKRQGSQFMQMQKLNPCTIKNIIQETSDNIPIYLFVHLSINDSIVPVIITNEDMLAYYPHLHSMQSPEFADSMQAILSRPYRRMYITSLNNPAIKMYDVDQKEYNKLLKINNHAAVRKTYFNEEGVPNYESIKKTDGYLTNQVYSAMAYLIDHNYRVSAVDLSGDIYVSKAPMIICNETKK